MPDVQTVIGAIMLASFAWTVWAALLTGRLPAGQPEDESDERWSRAFLGSIGVLCGGAAFVVLPHIIARVPAALFVIGSAVMIASAFEPRLRRLRSD